MNAATRHPLRLARENENLSIEELAEATNLSYRTIWRAEHGNSIHPSSRRMLCTYFGKSVHELGLLDAPVSEQQKTEGQLSSWSTNESMRKPVLLQATQDNIITKLLESCGVDIMDTSRRQMLQQVLQAAGVSLLLPSQLLDAESWHQLSTAVSTARFSSVDHATLNHFEQITSSCWHLSNNSELEVVEQLLPTYLPKLATLAHQTSASQKKAAHLAAQGYILAAEVERSSIPAMQEYCRLAVQYSQIAADPNMLVAALKQQATIYLVAKDPLKALQTYQQALPFVDQVSPLLRSRIYLGIGSAYARNGRQYKQEALRYLGLAHDGFPDHPEEDPNYLYTVCGLGVLHLYDGLTRLDLNQFQDAWNAFERVGGLKPNIIVPENFRVEIVNLQAQVAVSLKDMDQAYIHVHAGMEAAKTMGHKLRFDEAHDAYKRMLITWPNESRIKNLAEAFAV